ncbi:unnamed protein product [Paramecium sonneborni]|uniref:Uncharacterized protein n=1 Tax=Paramecium sonneborni TaxID=65129 RepID=A0A8S1LTT5_9CILI|nr:unnamed protein product [Paramecium sonneborni]
MKTTRLQQYQVVNLTNEGKRFHLTSVSSKFSLRTNLKFGKQLVSMLDQMNIAYMSIALNLSYKLILMNK